MSALRKVGWPLGILTLLVLLVFSRAWMARFVQWDDPDLVITNPGLNPPTVDHTLQFWKRPTFGLYSPLAYSAWSALTCLSADPSTTPATPQPLAFHVFNLALHITAVLSLYWLLRELQMSTMPALVGAAFFAIHPLQVEPVMWVSGMNNLLAGALVLASLAAYCRMARGTQNHRRWWCCALVFFVLALLSKPTAVVAPVLALILDTCIFRRRLATALKSLAPWFLLAVVCAFVARRAQPASGVALVSIGERLLVCADACAFYLRQVVFPIHLTIDYQRTPGWLMVHRGQIVVSLAVLAIAIPLLAVQWMRAPLALAVAALLPVSGLVTFDFQAISTVADRYMYLPLGGLALLVARGWNWRASALVRSLILTALVACAALSFQRTSAWVDTRHLAASVLAIHPRDPIGHKILAASLAQNGENAEAEANYRLAISDFDADPRPRDGVVYYDYANLLYREDKRDEAIAQYRTAIDYLRGTNKARALHNLGVALMDAGDRRNAQAAFDESDAIMHAQ